MANGKKKQFNIVDEIVRDVVGGAPEGGGVSSWEDLPGEIPKEKLPEPLRFGSEIVRKEFTGYSKNYDISVAMSAGYELIYAVDGVEYRLTAKHASATVDSNSGSLWYVGDFSLCPASLYATPDDTTNPSHDVPFFFGITNSDQSVGYEWAYGSTVVGAETVSVFKETATTTPLSDEYISENIARVSDIPTGGGNIVIVNVISDPAYPEQTWRKKADKTMDEIVAAWESGAAVFVRHADDDDNLDSNMMLPLACIEAEAVVFATVWMPSGLSSTEAYLCRVIINASGEVTACFNPFTVSNPT